jgi:hypothetical protein
VYLYVKGLAIIISKNGNTAQEKGHMLKT